MIIKVCGLKEGSNIIDITQLPIDMIGYNFYPSSARYIEDQPPAIPYIKKVGVFVNAPIPTIQTKVSNFGLDLVQLHGDETREFVAKIIKTIPVIKVFRIDPHFDKHSIKPFEGCDYYLFDTATAQYGGSGKKFEWARLLELDIDTPFLISGGIGPADFLEIKQFSHPYFVGIDINSKFETSPGVKDKTLIETFIADLKK